MNTILFKDKMVPNVFLFERITERKNGNILVTSAFMGANGKKIFYIDGKKVFYMYKRILGMCKYE